MDDIVLRLNKAEDLDQVLQVSEEVFKPSPQEREKYQKKSDWLEKMNDGLLISAVVDDKIVGFAICYKKERDLHIWNVGVLSGYRKRGIWRRMYEEIIKFATKNNYLEVSLNTYKDKFPGMYGFCKKMGFVEHNVELDTLSDHIKSMFKKGLLKD